MKKYTIKINCGICGHIVKEKYIEPLNGVRNGLCEKCKPYHILKLIGFLNVARKMIKRARRICLKN